jgi:hypothetical protein
MSKLVVYVFLVICLILLVFIGVGWYLLKGWENKEIGDKVNRIKCEYGGSTYQQSEFFLIRRDLGCSICICDEDGLSTCEKTYCPEEAPNE